MHTEDINEDDFQEKVIEASKENLILVDFWAPWCGPCKQLTPLLEKVVNSAEGKVRLIKINIDENKQIASQFKIQSIPAVFIFKNSQPIDAFQGVLPENKIIEFIEKSLGEKLKKDHSFFYQSIKKLINEKKYKDAISSLDEFIAENPGEIKSIALYMDCLGFLKKYKEAKKFYEALNEELIKDALIKSAYQNIDIKEKNSQGPSLEQLIEVYNKKPKDEKNILNLADKYFSENLVDEAFNILLENYRSNKEEIKKKILEFFEILGSQNSATIKYRRKLSSIIFS
jgi:putative thioredoxin